MDQKSLIWKQSSFHIRRIQNQQTPAQKRGSPGEGIGERLGCKGMKGTGKVPSWWVTPCSLETPGLGDAKQGDQNVRSTEKSPCTHCVI